MLLSFSFNFFLMLKQCLIETYNLIVRLVEVLKRGDLTVKEVTLETLARGADLNLVLPDY